MLAKLKNIPMAILLLSVAHAVTDLSQGGLLVALPYFKAKFALTYAQVSAIILVQNLTSSTIQPIFGYMSDRGPRPWLMPAGCLFSGIAMVGALFAPNYPLLLLCTVLNGLCIASFHPEAAKTANRCCEGASKGKGVSLFVVGGNAGFALGSFFLAALLISGGEERFFWYILPNILIGIPLYKLAASLPEMRRGSKQAGKLNIAFTKPLLALLGVVLVRSTVSSGISSFIPLYYVSYLHGSELYASSLLSTGLAAGAIGTLVGGTMSDKYGSKRVMLWSIVPIPIMLYLFDTISGSTWEFAAIGGACALLSASFSSSLVLVQQMMPNNVGMASGLAIGFSVGLGGMGVLALGKVADIWSLPAVFDILTLLPVLGFMLTLFVREVAEERTEYVPAK